MSRWDSLRGKGPVVAYFALLLAWGGGCEGVNGKGSQVLHEILPVLLGTP